MKKTKLVILGLFLLASCDVGSTKNSTLQSPLPQESAIANTAQTEEKPLPVIQLTYISTCYGDSNCMYGMDVQGLDSEHPSFGASQQLFEIRSSGVLPNAPVIAGRWSPNGRKIALEAVGNNGQTDIFIGDGLRANWLNLTNSSNYEGDPNWSPSSQTIFFIGSTGEPNFRGAIFSSPIDGSNNDQLFRKLDSSFPSIDDFSLSPDGKRIVFSHTVDLYRQLYIVDLDGSNLLQLTNRKEEHRKPSFSPDGQWIIYLRQPNKDEFATHLYLIRPDGSEEQIIPVGALDLNENASLNWSPIGNWIAFVSYNHQQGQMYIVHPDGTGLTSVNQSGIDVSFLAWRTILP